MSHPTPIELGVNIDHVATLRQVRGTAYPEPVHAALVAEQAGADVITVHLREDRRHIQDRDVELIRQTLGVRLNLEMAATAAMVDIAKRIAPTNCCLVPERRDELTTEGGLDVIAQRPQLREVCAALAGAGVEVSLFIDPEPAQIDAAVAVGAPAIELHTGAFALAASAAAQRIELVRIIDAARLAAAAGLRVNAGHGLHYQNVGMIAEINEIAELNIGHSIIARAVFSGLHAAVVEMKRLMREARR